MDEAEQIEAQMAEIDAKIDLLRLSRHRLKQKLIRLNAKTEAITLGNKWRENAERDEDIYRRKEAGETFKAIAERYSLSPLGVLKIFERKQRARRHDEEMADGRDWRELPVWDALSLGTRTRNFLQNEGFETMGEVAEAVAHGEIDPKTAPNFGRVSFDALVGWLHTQDASWPGPGAFPKREPIPHVQRREDEWRKRYGS